MKSRITALLSALVLLCSGTLLRAEDQSAVATELKDVISQLRTKIQDGKTTEADLAPEIKQMDALLAKHKDEKTDDVAQILFLKATLYAQVFDDYDKARDFIKQLKQDYPNTKPGLSADKVLESFDAHVAADKIQKTLAVGSPFPDFSEQDFAGKPLSVANYKGKVVMIDFWATWCGPCRGELPNVLKTYQAHHDKGFEIIGVSLDEDKDKLSSFIAEQKMPWPQFFDGKGWSNKLGVKYGIQSIPATFLLDGDGKIIGKNLRGEALEAAVSKALAAK